MNYKLEILMQTISASELVMLSLPNDDIALLCSLSNKMGWTIHRKQKSGIEKGLEDIRKGNVFHAQNSEVLIIKFRIDQCMS